MKKKEKIDPESYKGKIRLLIWDKVIIGGMIAIAFIVYNYLNTIESRKYNERFEKNQREYNEAREEIQLSFKKAEYKKELYPIVLNNEIDFRLRIHSFSSLVETKSIDEYSIVELCKELFNSPKLYFYNSNTAHYEFPMKYYNALLTIMLKSMPSSINNILNEYKLINKEIEGKKYLRVNINNKDDILYDTFLNTFHRLLHNLILKSLEFYDDNQLSIMNDTAFLAKNLEILYQITRSMKIDKIRSMSNRHLKGMRILYLLRLLDHNEPFFDTYCSNELTNYIFPYVNNKSVNVLDSNLAYSIISIIWEQYQEEYAFITIYHSKPDASAKYIDRPILVEQYSIFFKDLLMKYLNSPAWNNISSPRDGQSQYLGFRVEGYLLLTIDELLSSIFMSPKIQQKVEPYLIQYIIDFIALSKSSKLTNIDISEYGKISTCLSILLYGNDILQSNTKKSLKTLFSLENGKLRNWRLKALYQKYQNSDRAEEK